MGRSRSLLLIWEANVAQLGGRAELQGAATSRRGSARLGPGSPVPACPWSQPVVGHSCSLLPQVPWNSSAPSWQSALFALTNLNRLFFLIKKKKKSLEDSSIYLILECSLTFLGVWQSHKNYLIINKISLNWIDIYSVISFIFWIAYY